MADKPGRTHERMGTARHALEYSSDPERIEEKRFAAEVAEMLDRAVTGKACDRLIVAAPPVMLGDLREAGSAAVKEATVAELDKDLTRIPEQELASHFESVIAL